MAALRPRTSVLLPRWRCFTTATYPAWRVNNVHQSKLHPPTVILPTRGYAEELTSQELSDRVIQVLKLFDKIDPTKVLVHSTS